MKDVLYLVIFYNNKYECLYIQKIKKNNKYECLYI